ncbi:Rpn family recombination-promoting nuclease/putative transposase, partial [Schinkia azotoformans]
FSRWSFKQIQNEGNINENDRLAKWIEFLINEDDSQWAILASKDPIIKKAVERLGIISQNPENRRDYEIRQKALKDITTMKEGAREEGREQGREEGREQGKVEVAIKLLCKGIGIDVISETTGFTKDEILKLQKNLNKE